ncbi:hypothetical protein C8R43DRAFT_944827 [Mycena crocata]|nr:hypothetical protein C8R43DRAFT_944827 [Mycena crocata]
MPDAATQTQWSTGSGKVNEILFLPLPYLINHILEVLDFVEGRGGQPSSEVLQWLGRQLIHAKDRPSDAKELESEVMRQIRKERTEYALRLREGWEERNVGRPWMQFYPRKKPSTPDWHLGTLQVSVKIDERRISEIASESERKASIGYGDDGKTLAATIARWICLTSHPTAVKTTPHQDFVQMEKNKRNLDGLRFACEYFPSPSTYVHLPSSMELPDHKLDDEDLAFEAEMRPSEEFVCWEQELEVLKEERRHIISCIEHSEKFCEVYKPEEEEEEAATREPISVSDLIHLKNMWKDSDHYNTESSPTTAQLANDAQEKTRLETAPKSTEIRERRRLEAAEASNAGDVKTTWVSDLWNAAMDSVVESEAPGDSGLSDESDLQSDSLDATQIICDRSYPRGDPLEAVWDALTIRLWPNYEMPAGVRHSLPMEHPSRPPRNTEVPKHFDSLAVDLFAPRDPAQVNEDLNCIAWFEVRQVVVIVDENLFGGDFELITRVIDEDELRKTVIEIL